EVYRDWSLRLNARFHYVSASPWQLYLPLAEFVRTNGFPEGTFHLKPFRVKDESFFDLFKSPEHYKPGVIEPLLKRFPGRRFVLVGDSGERDPEIYGALARRFPDQVKRVLIRDVTGEGPDAARYQKAFRDVPRERWVIFEKPDKVKDSVRLED
ncbi:MAG TPA: App1 family protein, partial [Verrucomicrobiae bacterium]|nr:App1 family protein [Verrucomicrobiae bacterium]